MSDTTSNGFRILPLYLNDAEKKSYPKIVTRKLVRRDVIEPFLLDNKTNLFVRIGSNYGGEDNSFYKQFKGAFLVGSKKDNNWLKPITNFDIDYVVRHSSCSADEGAKYMETYMVYCKDVTAPSPVVFNADIVFRKYLKEKNDSLRN